MVWGVGAGNVQSSDPHDDPPYETGETPSTGPVPDNIRRGAGEHWVGGDGFDDSDFDDLDGDDDPHDADYDVDLDEDHVDDSEDDDCGPVAGNIVVDAADCDDSVVRGRFSAETLRQAGQAGVPGPLSGSRL